jgi:hypothetical protein
LIAAEATGKIYNLKEQLLRKAPNFIRLFRKDCGSKKVKKSVFELLSSFCSENRMQFPF